MSQRLSIIVFSLIIVSIGLSNLWEYVEHEPIGKIETIEDRIQAIVISQQSKLENLAYELSESSDPFKVEIQGEGSLRVYDNGSLIYWNDNKHLPEYSKLKQLANAYVLEHEGSIYLIARKTTNYNQNSLLEYFSVIPLFTKYPLSNEFLKDRWNSEVFQGINVQYNKELQNVRITGDSYTGFMLIEGKGYQQSTRVDILFIVTCLLLLLLLFHPSNRLIVVGTSLMFIYRVVKMIFFPDFHLIYSSFDDPTIYYDSWWLPSISDLIFHQLILLLWVFHVSRFIHARLPFNPFTKHRSTLVKYFTGFILLTLAIGNFKLFFDLIWSINNNTLSSLDITESLSFNGLRWMLVLSFFLQALILFFGNHWILHLLKKHYSIQYQVLVVLLIGVLSYIFIPEFVLINWVVAVGFILSIQLSAIKIDIGKFKYHTLAYISYVGLGLAIITAYANYEYFEKTNNIKKEKFASSVLLGNDIVGEYYINELTSLIQSDPFIRSRFLNQLLAQQNIKIRISTQIPIYLDKYEWDIHTYNAEGAPYGLTEDTDLDYWVHSYAIPEYETGYENVYFVDSQTGRKKYISIIPVSFYDQLLGNIVLEFTQKKYTTNTVFPSLLVEKNPFASDKEFDYAIYADKELLYSQGDFEFEQTLNESKIEDIFSVRKGKEFNGFHFLGKSLSDGRQLILVSKVYPWIGVIANSSFYLLIFVVIAAISYSTFRIVVPNVVFSLSNKIQFYIGASFLLPMLFVLTFLLQILNGIYLSDLTDSYEMQARSIAENIAATTADFINNDINRDQYYYEIQQAAQYSQNDIIIYDPKGRLLGTNRNEVFNLHLLSSRINPLALKNIQSEKGQLVVLDEQIGDLSFKNVYTSIFDIKSGKNLGIISIPFFNFQKELKSQQTTVFQNLIVLIALVLIITLFVSQFNLRRIIQPIKTISELLNKTSYLEDNTPILTYQSKDEIGQLVDEYNAMVAKLKISKEELAAIQKESAWKEIARQVAHEIKNPLTPMRLKIQQLQRHFEPNSKQFMTLESLFAQVDTLAMIADSFSAFAKMPAPKNETFDLSKVIRHAAALFQTDEVTIKAEISENIKVFADEKLIGQIINNLILNAIQSQKEAQKLVEIVLANSQNKALIEIKDSGEGIPDELKEKIFKPYFSTKDTGSGIGLALAKKGIEQANGAIWFESEEGRGTTFYISFPRV